MKILSPVGDFESLRVAILNGADEIYFGVNEFNARNNIQGFTLSDVKEIASTCRLFNVRSFLAVNILFLEEELESAVNLIVDAYKLGVDAFIIQDLALADILSKNYPFIEIHASTQMGIHNLEGVEAIKKYNFKRVVLARETPLSEIKRIKENCDIEIEYFVQGALCVSFSGNCYLSSYLLNASGNRGKCKQLCRLPYKAYLNGKEIKKGYLLSAKDFCLIDRIKELKDAGVYSLKIEGRARRPFYVAMATGAYRNAVDGKPYDMQDLKLAFNRNYCPGYFDGNGKIISNIQNHIGIEIGVIERINNGKRFNEIFINSKRQITPKSVLKFFDGETEAGVITAYDVVSVRPNLFKVTTTAKLKSGLKVNLIVDAIKENEIYKQFKKDITLNIVGKVGTPLRAIFNLNGEQYTFESEAILEQARTSFLTGEEIKNNFAKSQIFNVYAEIAALDKVFILKSSLNAFRKAVLEDVYKLLTETKREAKSFKYSFKQRLNNLASVQVIENLNTPITATNVIYSPEEYLSHNILKFVDNAKNQKVNFYLDLPNFALKDDIAFLKRLVEENDIPIVVNNYYALGFNVDKIIGAGLNVYNNYTANLLDSPVITAESGVGYKMDAPYMTLRHCPIKHLYNCDCSSCKYSSGITYRTDDGKQLQLKRKKLSTCTFYLC